MNVIRHKKDKPGGPDRLFVSISHRFKKRIRHILERELILAVRLTTNGKEIAFVGVINPRRDVVRQQLSRW